MKTGSPCTEAQRLLMIAMTLPWRGDGTFWITDLFKRAPRSPPTGTALTRSYNGRVHGAVTGRCLTTPNYRLRIGCALPGLMAVAAGRAACMDERSARLAANEAVFRAGNELIERAVADSSPN